MNSAKHKTQVWILATSDSCRNWSIWPLKMWRPATKNTLWHCMICPSDEALHRGRRLRRLDKRPQICVPNLRNIMSIRIRFQSCRWCLDVAGVLLPHPRMPHAPCLDNMDWLVLPAKHLEIFSQNQIQGSENDSRLQFVKDLIQIRQTEIENNDGTIDQPARRVEAV